MIATTTSHLPREEVLDNIRELIRNVQIGMLTTRTSSGELWTRPMVTPRYLFDGTLWFISSADDPKIRDIEQNPHVSVTYTDSSRPCYASLSGTAEILQDEALIQQLWTEDLATWLPDDFVASKLDIIKINVHELEYWSAAVPQGASAKSGSSASN